MKTLCKSCVCYGIDCSGMSADSCFNKCIYYKKKEENPVETVKCIPLKVLRPADPVYAETSNGGISGRYYTVYVEHPRGFRDIPKDAPNLCEVECWPNGNMFLKPRTMPPVGHTDYMFGGNYAESSDGRFAEISPHPLRIHDRTETWEVYERLSR